MLAGGAVWEKVMNWWCMKTEPEVYAWSDLLRDGRGVWDGVRSYQARNNMKAMVKGDGVLIYHSVEERAIVGVARVIKEAYQDPTTSDERWVAVDLEPWQSLSQKLELGEIRKDAVLAELALVRQSRLSVMPVSEACLARILELTGTTLVLGLVLENESKAKKARGKKPG